MRRFKTPIFSAVTFFWTLGILSVGYGAYTGLSSVTAGQPLTVSAWTQVKDNLDDHETRITGLASQVASIVAWGGNPWSAVTGWLAYNGGKVGIGTSTPLRKLHVTGDEQLDGDLYGGLYGGTRGIWRFSSADPNFGIFYTEASPDYISFSPNGWGTGSSIMTVTGYGVGIGTAAPSEKLEINGNIKFSANGSVISKAPRVVRSSDPGAGCPPTRAANTDLWTMPVTLDRNSTVFLSADSIKSLSVRADFQLYLDGNMMAQTISPPSTDWVGWHVQWSGTVAAWAHTVSVRSPQANAWGCGASWGNMEALIFEN